MSKLITSAKEYERIANRLAPNKSKLSEDDKQKTLKRQLDDTWTSLESALRKDGTTGFLSEGDGLVKMEPLLHKGFKIEIYGGKVYESGLDIYGRFVWFGTAEATEEIKHKTGRVYFETEILIPKGFETNKACAYFLMQLVDLYRNPGSNRKQMKLGAETIQR